MKSIKDRARRWPLGFSAYLLCLIVVVEVSTLSWPAAAAALVLLVGVFLCVKAFWTGGWKLIRDRSPSFTSVPMRTGKYAVSLTSAGPRRIEIIRRVRSVKSASLREAKEIVDNLPALVVSGIDESDALRIAAELRTAGAEVSITGQPPES